jgi:LCP family protein required for cell wall assembly
VVDRIPAAPPTPGVLPAAPPERQSRSRGNRALRIASWIVTVLSAIALIAAGGTYAVYLHDNAAIKRVALKHNTGGVPDYGGSENFLLVGDDSRDGLTPKQLKEYHTTTDGGGVNTDVLMVAHVLPRDKGVDIVSIPRDSWVDIPGYGYGKINSAFADAGGGSAGASLLVRVIEQITGLHIDHVAMVNFSGFVTISDDIGGVRVCVPKGEYGNGFHDKNSGINLNPGYHVIKGATALAFVRQRYDLPQSDLSRIQLQHEYISGAMKKLESAGVLLNPVRLYDLAEAVSKSLTLDTGFGLAQFYRLAEALKQTKPGAVKFLTYPVTNAAYWPSGTPYVGEEAVELNGTLGSKIFTNIADNRAPNYGSKVRKKTSVVSAAAKTCLD